MSRMNPKGQTHSASNNPDDNELFVSLEGIDFTGKTTILKRLGRELGNLKVHPLLTADPAKLKPWIRMKKEILDTQTRIAGPAEALLYLAGRVDNVVRKIRPALDQGRAVISDRFVDSWISYWAPRLGAYFGSVADAIRWLSNVEGELRTRGFDLLPGRTYLLLDDPVEATKRAPKKPRSKWEVARTLEQVQKVYLQLAKREKERFRIVDIRKEGLRGAADKVVGDATRYISEILGL